MTADVSRCHQGLSNVIDDICPTDYGLKVTWNETAVHWINVRQKQIEKSNRLSTFFHGPYNMTYTKSNQI